MIHAFRLAAAALAVAAAAAVLGSPTLTAQSAAQLRLAPFASGFTLPLAFVQDPLDARVQYVVQQGGHVRTILSGQVQPVDFVDLSGAISSGGERGLLGMAFQPDDPDRVFFDFTDPAGNTVVARFTRTTPGSRAVNLNSRVTFKWSTGLSYIQQPFANHNGGNLAFGPDGDLYIGLGDGGNGDDPLNNGQTMTTLLGKILRVDVRGNPAAGFAIPTDNPFAASSRPEIWDTGVRNPWRFSFDDPARGGTGALIIGDVGQNQYEEVDYEPAGEGGRNYGWRIREGMHDHITTLGPAFLPLTDPIYEYDHTVGNSITGGYVYRGGVLPSMNGRYFFADYVRGRIWSMIITPNATTGEGVASGVVEHTSTLAFTGNVSSFGVDAAGELYVVNYSAGTVLRLTSQPATPTNLRIIR